MVTTDEPFDLGFELGELSELAKQAQWDSLNAYGDLLTRVTPEGWARRLADLNVRYCEQLLKGTHSLSDRWVEAVERVMPRPAETRRKAAEGPRRLPMSLHAQSGATAEGSISLHNKQHMETEVSFLVSSFTSSDGESIRPSVTVRPEQFSLGPLEERIAVISVHLDPELFPPGRLFRGTMAVRGYDDLELMLTVWADE